MKTHNNHIQPIHSSLRSSWPADVRRSAGAKRPHYRAADSNPHDCLALRAAQPRGSSRHRLSTPSAFLSLCYRTRIVQAFHQRHSVCAHQSVMARLLGFPILGPAALPYWTCRTFFDPGMRPRGWRSDRAKRR